jgi:hypothetical protein
LAFKFITLFFNLLIKLVYSAPEEAAQPAKLELKESSNSWSFALILRSKSYTFAYSCKTYWLQLQSAPCTPSGGGGIII